MQTKPVDYEVADFQADVLQASNERPIMVDFWAPWCGPCRALGPVLERLASGAGDRWTLVKVNTDTHPQLMAHYGVRGIPAVKLFVDGAVTAEFTGALPEAAVRSWLDEHIPSPERALLEEARRRLADGEREAAREMAEALLDSPVGDEARVLLARLVVLEEPERARELVRDHFGPIAEAVRTVAGFLAIQDADLPDSQVRQDYLAARGELKGGGIDAALGHLMYVLKNDRPYHDDGARKVIVALFTLLGEQHPDVRKHRPTFNMSLY
ncbi:tetratricopeptide repeat protein [soil metagenome]